MEEGKPESEREMVMLITSVKEGRKELRKQKGKQVERSDYKLKEGREGGEYREEVNLSVKVTIMMCRK